MSKLVPERPKVTLADAFKEVEELRNMQQNPMLKHTLKLAEDLEGSIQK
jgi:DNA polymerase III alpha subunit